VVEISEIPAMLVTIAREVIREIGKIVREMIKEVGWTVRAALEDGDRTVHLIWLLTLSSVLIIGVIASAALLLNL
jgi:TRAP-type uncharacterized transport system fused permease subunit